MSGYSQISQRILDTIERRNLLDTVTRTLAAIPDDMKPGTYGTSPEFFITIFGSYTNQYTDRDKNLYHRKALIVSDTRVGTHLGELIMDLIDTDTINEVKSIAYDQAVFPNEPDYGYAFLHYGDYVRCDFCGDWMNVGKQLKDLNITKQDSFMAVCNACKDKIQKASDNK